MPVYNPTEVKINMKKVQSEGKFYFIGNCDMELGLKDTVIKFYPPRDPDSRYGSLSINAKKQTMDYEATDSRRPQDDEADEQENG